MKRSTIVVNVVVTFVASFLILVPVASATGTHLDLSFNTTGTSIIFGSGLAINDAAIQSDGKVVLSASGPDGIFFMRYNTDGTFDTGSGVAIVPGVNAQAIAIQPDGKILVAGWDVDTDLLATVIIIVRFNPDGSRDSSFGNVGIVSTPIGSGGIPLGNDMALQSDGKIVIAGSYTAPGNDRDILVMRYNTNGTLDTSFSGNGYLAFDSGNDLPDDGRSVAIQSDGKILVGGTTDVSIGGQNFTLARFTSTGIADPSFGGGDGVVLSDFSLGDDGIEDIKVLPDGKIMAGGSATQSSRKRFALARYTSTGSLDTTFNGNGKLTTEVSILAGGFIRQIALQSDGKIVAVGSNDANGAVPGDFTIVRYNANGTLDAAFGQGGKLRTDVNFGADNTANCVVIQPDGRIVVGGTAQAEDVPPYLVLARYLPNIDPKFDYDSDSKSDLSVYRPSAGGWYLLRSQLGFTGVGFGVSTDRIAPADYDGDGRTDVAVYRPSAGVWYILRSSNNSLATYVFGAAEDLPTPADYDGDGQADVSLFRPSAGAWYRLNSSDGAFAQVQFGANGDKPTVGDFDGDGRADVAVFRPSVSTWYRLNSGDGAFVPTAFGASTDIVTPADYDGDGKTDISVFRPSVGSWYRYNSNGGAFVAIQFGANGDIPSPGDYDRDGRADLTVFRPAEGGWYRLNSSNGSFFAQQFGQNGDRPTPSAFQY